ncbi:MAG: hypothetical protein V4447_12640 [Pseudomonadota bacterium]
MNQTYMGWHVTKLFRYLSTVILATLLSACGGGGGSSGSVPGGSTVTQTPNGKIVLSLVDQTGVASNHISGAGGLLAKATVTDSKGASAGPGILVTFSLDGSIATLSATSGTALTGSDGVATIGLKAGVGTGAGTLTASAIVVGTVAVTAKTTFDVSSPPNAIPVAINFVAALPSDNSIVIKGTGGISRSEVALLTFAVVDATNTGIPNVKVDFSLLPVGDVVLGAASGTTGPDGKVSVTVSSGSTVTSVVVTATVDSNPAIKTKSDTITVTTGTVSTAHFDIYPEKLNLEAFNIAGVENKVTAYLADANGGVVADGVPVVFTTTAGAIVGDAGTTATARCLTKNGTCSVTWRSQAPFSPTPIVTATVSDGSLNLVKTTSFTANASYGRFVGLPTTVTFTAGVATCVPQTFDFMVEDSNGYSMPTGTTMGPSDVTNVAATIFPATITAKAAVQIGGTSHTLTITPTALCPAGIGHFFLELKSPTGAISAPTKINIVYQ